MPDVTIYTGGNADPAPGKTVKLDYKYHGTYEIDKAAGASGANTSAVVKVRLQIDTPDELIQSPYDSGWVTATLVTKDNWEYQFPVPPNKAGTGAVITAKLYDSKGELDSAEVADFSVRSGPVIETTLEPGAVAAAARVNGPAPRDPGSVPGYTTRGFVFRYNVSSTARVTAVVERRYPNGTKLVKSIAEAYLSDGALAVLIRVPTPRLGTEDWLVLYPFNGDGLSLGAPTQQEIIT